MIHYHGTPITPRSALRGLRGCHFCVSFARPDDEIVCMEIGQSIMWDNGAFSAFTQGITQTWSVYYEWLEHRLGHPHWAVVPDVIMGTEDDQRQLIKQWPHGRTLGAPVWHMHLPIRYLLELCDSWAKVCIGSSAKYWRVGSQEWCGRMDTAFNAIAQRHKTLPWIHMLRGLGLAGTIYPFASADSTNVARNHSRSGIPAKAMARKIDAVQNPIRWQRRAVQEEIPL